MKNKLYVGNLSFDTTDEGLSQAFAQFGTVKSARVMTDRDTGRSRGFGFVEMGTDEEANEALAMDGRELDGRNLKVNIAKPPSERSFDRGRDRGFGSHGGGRRDNRDRDRGHKPRRQGFQIL